MAMATAQLSAPYPPSANGNTYRSYDSAANFPRNARKLSPSQSLRKIMPSAKSLPYRAQQMPPASSTIPATDSLRNKPNQGALIAAKISSDHAKLLKRPESKASDRSLKTAAVQRTGPSFARPLTPPYTPRDSPVDPSYSPSSTARSRDRLKHNLKKLAQTKEEDRDGIDLSKTAAENEQRSGLNIYNHGSANRSATDVNFYSTNRVRHTRSISHTSQQSGISDSFRPTAPFVHVMRPTPRPFTPTTFRSYDPSVIGSDVSDEGFPRLREDNTGNGLKPVTSYQSASMPATTERPPLYINTSGSASRLASVSQTNLSVVTSSNLTPPMRSRGGTNRSIDTLSPHSRPSYERALSFVRRPTQDSDLADPVTRAATINAARQAFAEREEAKARKYEKQEQKAVDRQNKKKAKQENRKQQHAGIHESRIRDRSVASKSSERMDLFPAMPDYTEMSTFPNQSLPVRRRTGGQNESQEGATAAWTTIASVPTGEKVKKHPRVSRQKEVTRNRYLRFLTWLKIKLLNLGKRRRKSH